jgi:hypothetical protein
MQEEGHTFQQQKKKSSSRCASTKKKESICGFARKRQTDLKHNKVKEEVQEIT